MAAADDGGVRSRLEAWFRAAVERVRPDRLVEEALASRAGAFDGVTILGLGKAAGPMVEGARRALGARIVAVTCVVPDGAPAPDGALRAGHPVPDERSVAAARALVAAAAAAHGPIVALISGGGSALAAMPAPGLSLGDKQAAITALAAAGAPIAEINCVRRHLSAIKGGRLAAVAGGAVLTLAVSDVVGDRLFDIASGPTVADPTSPADARIVLDRRLGARAPAAARQALEAAARGDAGSRPPARPADEAVLLAGRRALVDAALAVAREDGADAAGWPTALDDGVERVADLLAGWLTSGEGGAMIAGGEPTVMLPARAGRGGRAQHLALLVARRIAGEARIGFLAAGSDGIDGSGPAAGAVIDGDSWAAIGRAGVDPDACLAAFDAARALEAIGATIVCGPTGANHADLMIASRV